MEQNKLTQTSEEVIKNIFTAVKNNLSDKLVWYENTRLNDTSNMLFISGTAKKSKPIIEDKNFSKFFNEITSAHHSNFKDNTEYRLLKGGIASDYYEIPLDCGGTVYIYIDANFNDYIQICVSFNKETENFFNEQLKCNYQKGKLLFSSNGKAIFPSKENNYNL